MAKPKEAQIRHSPNSQINHHCRSTTSPPLPFFDGSPAHHPDLDMSALSSLLAPAAVAPLHPHYRINIWLFNTRRMGLQGDFGERKGGEVGVREGTVRPWGGGSCCHRVWGCATVGVGQIYKKEKKKGGMLGKDKIGKWKWKWNRIFNYLLNYFITIRFDIKWLKFNHYIVTNSPIPDQVMSWFNF